MVHRMPRATRMPALATRDARSWLAARTARSMLLASVPDVRHTTAAVPHRVAGVAIPAARCAAHAASIAQEVPVSEPVPDRDDLFRLAVESSPSGLIAVDGEGRIRLVNREIERMFGYTRDELICQPIETLIPQRFHASHPKHRSAYVSEPRARRMGAGRDLYGVRKDGTEVPVEIGLNSLRTTEGLVVLGSIVDISERVTVEGQLRQAQKLEAVGTLAGGIAHDFNNLLLAIVGYAELARRHGSGHPELLADLEHILQAAARGRTLVQRILSFSRKRELARVRVRLDSVVREAVHLLRASLPSAIEIRELIGVRTPDVLGDETQVHQIVMNLSTNAAHAMPDGGVLEIGLRRADVDDRVASSHPGLMPGAYAVLSVTDTGAGMSREVLERATEPFFTTKPVGVGTGLGLSVIHGIVRSLSGALEIRSEPGRGTEVDIYLPAAPAEPGRRDDEAAAGPEPAGTFHIMLVEDEASLAAMMGRRLQELGYRATVHTSSVDACAQFQREPQAFDLLITDGTMPRMSGLALSREVRRLRPELPILLVSGLAETSDPKMLEDAGVTATLPKPNTEREMAEILRKLLATRA